MLKEDPSKILMWIYACLLCRLSTCLRIILRLTDDDSKHFKMYVPHPLYTHHLRTYENLRYHFPCYAYSMCCCICVVVFVHTLRTFGRTKEVSGCI